MEIGDIVDRVVAIKQAAGDDEAAHSMEVSLWADVLRAIADGAPHSDLLARAALATTKIEFRRWCA